MNFVKLNNFIKLTLNMLQPNCTTKLEIATFEHSIVLEILYAVGFAFIGIIINRAGKLPILRKFLFVVL